MMYILEGTELWLHGQHKFWHLLVFDYMTESLIHVLFNLAFSVYYKYKIIFFLTYFLISLYNYFDVTVQPHYNESCL